MAMVESLVGGPFSETALAPGAATTELPVSPTDATVVGGGLRPVLAAPPESARIGRYVILEVLGSGGMGVVLAAYDPKLDRKVAIKLIHGRHQGDHTLRARMEREAQAMARLSHPNVVTVYEVGEHQGDLYLAIEFIKGSDLGHWLRERPTTWRQVLALFLQAGQGLAAAHQAGIVHRDFKPPNVFVGDDGRVRVGDFGLARQEGEVNAEAVAMRARAQVDSGVLAIRHDLTATGAIMGTPAYMAPEQFAGEATDARTDQFSFCVALWEALYGARPFPGETLAELVVAVMSGRPPTPPAGRNVPVWVRRVLERGLSLAPGDRYPTTEALLAALLADPTRRRAIMVGITAAALAIAGGIGAQSWREARQMEACVAERGSLDGVWDEARRQEVRGAFLATGVPFAQETFVRVERGLDGFAETWTSEAEAHCEAVRRDDADVEACIARRRVELRALVDVFAQADIATVEHANVAVERLRDPELCGNPEALAAEQKLVPLPADPALAAAVSMLRERLATIHFLQLAGRFDEGLQRVGPLVEKARALGHPPLLAEGLLQQAVLWGKKADYPAADAGLLAAIMEAEGAGHHIVRAEALVHRIELAGSLQARAEAVADSIAPTRALVHHLAPGGVLEGRLLVNIGLVRYRQGDYIGAVESHEQAVALLELVLKEGDPEFLGALQELGRSYWRNGDIEAARRTLERARELTERELGPDHPLLIGIYLNLGNVMGADEALYLRSLELSTRTFGPGHPSAGLALGNLGSVYLGRAEYTRSLDAVGQAVAIQRRALGAHPLLAVNLSNLGNALNSIGRHDEALTVLRESVEIYERLYPAGHPDAVIGLINLSDTARRTGELVTSRDSLRRALVLTELPGATRHRDWATLELADTLVRMGAADEALELIRPLIEGPPQTPPFDTRIAFVYAQALWLAAPVERPRAHTLAKETEAKLVARLDPTTEGLSRDNDALELADVRNWLSGHSP